MNEETKKMIMIAISLSVYGQKRCYQAHVSIALKNGKDHEKVIELMHADMDNDSFCKSHNTSDAEKLHLWLDEKIKKGEA